MTKKKMTKEQSKKAIPLFKEFNTISKAFISALNRKILSKQKRLNKISILVRDVTIPDTSHTINVRNVDMRAVKKSSKKSHFFNPFANMEDDIERNKKRWII